MIANKTAHNKEVNMTSENIPVNAGQNNIDEVSWDKLVEPTSNKLSRKTYTIQFK